MGLSIHYGGNLIDAKLLTNLIEEVKNVAETYSWKYHVFHTVFPNEEFSKEIFFNNIYGISLTPPNCETLFFTFLNNGSVTCPMSLQFFANSQNQKEQAHIYKVSVKTQYGGVVLHQFIIHFIKYLNSKYFDDFKLTDESNYWETEDEEIMKSQFKKYDSLIDNFGLAIETFPLKKGESMFAYLERLIKKVNDLKK